MPNGKTIFQILVPELVSILQVENWVRIQRPQKVNLKQSEYDICAKSGKIKRKYSHLFKVKLKRVMAELWELEVDFSALWN